MPQTEDIMPLNEADRAWIRQEIQAAYKRQGWGKFTGFIKDWSGAGAAIGILIFLVTQWGTYIEFRTGTNFRLGNLEKSVEQITRELAPLQIAATTSLPTDTFQATLPGLKSVLATANKSDARVGPKVIADLQQKLLNTNQDAPSFWPTVAAFISYRSFNNTSWVAPSNLPNCTDSPPSPATVKQVDSPTQMQVNPGQYENCRFTLDSHEDDVRVNAFLLNGWPSITFRHCVIVYRGGPIDLIIALKETNVPYTLRKPPYTWNGTLNVSVTNTIEFDDCLFDIVFQDVPPQPGQRLTQFLLANNGPNIKLPISTHS